MQIAWVKGPSKMLNALEAPFHDISFPRFFRGWMHLNWAVMETKALNWKKDKKHRCIIALRDTHTSFYPCHCLFSTLSIRLVIYICDKTFSHAPFKQTPAPLGIISAEGSSQIPAGPVSPFFFMFRHSLLIICFFISLLKLRWSPQILSNGELCTWLCQTRIARWGRIAHWNGIEDRKQDGAPRNDHAIASSMVNSYLIVQLFPLPLSEIYMKGLWRWL